MNLISPDDSFSIQKSTDLGREPRASGRVCAQHARRQVCPIPRICSMDSLRVDRVCPVFMISNVTGKNLPHLRTLLNCLKTSQGSERYTTEGSFEFSISDCFSVPFVGAVAVSSPGSLNVFSLLIAYFECRAVSSILEKSIVRYAACLANPLVTDISFSRGRGRIGPGQCWAIHPDDHQINTA